MSLSTANITELRDQLFLAIEGGDLATVKRILELFPGLAEERVNDMSIHKFAARHGHSHILKYLGIKEDKDFVIDLIKCASIDGYRETISLLVNSISNTFPYDDLSCEFYKELESLVPESCRNAIYFPYIWNKVKGLLFLNKKGMLPKVSLKKLAKFLY